MEKARIVGWKLAIMTLAGCVAAFAATSAGAQGSAQQRLRISQTAADEAAADAAVSMYQHAKPANTPAGANLEKREIARALNGKESNGSGESSGDLLRFPGDLTFNGGAVVEFAESHAIFLLPKGNCPIATCWGDPEGFLKDLGRSEFIHVVDQYVDEHEGGRYTVGNGATISYTPPAKPLTNRDMLIAVHAVASATGQTGYGHIYHVFLPPGQDECFRSDFAVCYSPDNNNTFFFCAYHSSATFRDIGHVLFTVEPFQNVPGCAVKPGTPNGQLIDSTDNSLSHEQFETITDPDGTAWFNFTSVVLGGAEIGDECSFFVVLPPPPGFAFFDPSSFTIGRHRYAVQLEYSNSEHACASEP